MMDRAVKTAFNFSKSIYNDFKEFLSPSVCPLCEKRDPDHKQTICTVCLAELIDINKGFGPVCPFCGNSSDEINNCNNCDRGNGSNLFYWGEYVGLLKEGIIHFKFHNQTALGMLFSELAADAIIEKISNRNYDIIIPIPLYKARLRERRFNQSLIIANTVSDYLNHPKIDSELIIRNRSTKPNSLIEERLNRWNNVEEAFSISDTADTTDYTGKSFLVIDDIVTSGATFYNVNKELLKLKPSRVDILSLAYAK